ncbi:MAG: hypothetical protein B6242_16585 [Anaerolineaceae bacterium 4572_78]|nr:MAG: hypothetical protein B6242_16585 [Anaerolineaceae bacterium 4572_78]
MPEFEEKGLIVRAKQGDSDAFEVLYEMHKTSIYRAALLITGDASTAEEILQETFFRAYKNIDKLHEDVSMAPWLYRVAINLARDLTARRRRWRTNLSSIFERLVNSSPPTLEQVVEEQERNELVYNAINKLNFKQRTTLVLFYFQGFSLIEIGEIMNCPVGTIKSRLYYAKINLRRQLVSDRRLPQRLVYEFTS